MSEILSMSAAVARSQGAPEQWFKTQIRAVLENFSTKDQMRILCELQIEYLSDQKGLTPPAFLPSALNPEEEVAILKLDKSVDEKPTTICEEEEEG